MSQNVISVQNLGKRYYLGATLSPDTLRDHIMSAAGRLTGKRKKSDAANKKEVFWALKDISFDVAKGEILGLIGPNGAGKSTLLKILTGITEPTEGIVGMKGRVSSLLEVGTGFHPELSGRENIFLNGAILGMKRFEINSKFDEIVAFAEVERFLDTPVKRYSSGMRVRLGFAVAAHLEPEILLIDEVLAVGDFKFQEKCIGKMQEVSEAGRTILFVSHQMPAVRRFCTRCLLLKNGGIVMNDDTDEVVNTYLSDTADTAFIAGTDPVPGKLTLLDYGFLNKQGEKAAHLNFSEPFEMYFDLAAPGLSAEGAFLVRIYNSEGIKIASIGNRPYGFPWVKYRDRFRLVFQIKNNNLAPGKYLLDFEMGTPLLSRHLVCEKLQGMIINEKILPEGSQPYTAAHGTVFIDADLQVS